MTPRKAADNGDLAQRVADAEATIEARLAGQIDAVVASKSNAPVLLSKAQEALRASEERYRRIVETANEGIWTIDENSNTTFANGRMAGMLGYTAGEMIGMPRRSLVAEGDRAKAARSVERNRAGHSLSIDATVPRRDGSLLSSRGSGGTECGDEGECLRELAMLPDQT